MSEASDTDAKAPRYPIYEHFLSFQGEGIHLGRCAYFLRLYGCDQKCHFCDSAGTWHPDWKPPGVPLLETHEVVNLVKAGAIDAPSDTFVVLTGGEPALYDLDPLICALYEAGFPSHIETAGHRPVPRSAHWVTLSPKLFATPPLPENWQRAHEIKLICETPEQLRRDLDIILGARRSFMPSPIWLHPEWSQRENPELLRAIVEAVKAVPRCRAGWQVHKCYRADFLDANTRPDVPLGGVRSTGVSSDGAQEVSQRSGG